MIQFPKSRITGQDSVFSPLWQRVPNLKLATTLAKFPNKIRKWREAQRQEGLKERQFIRTMRGYTPNGLSGLSGSEQDEESRGSTELAELCTVGLLLFEHVKRTVRGMWV
jgi:hypothetical protein